MTLHISANVAVVNGAGAALLHEVGFPVDGRGFQLEIMYGFLYCSF